jgi:hypothetical protein
LNLSFSGERHESFEQSGASTARSFAEALVPIVEHIAHVIPQIAKIVNPADYLFELSFRQRANFAARSATRVANFEDSCEFFQREADSERSSDKPNALDRFRRILPVARCSSLGAWQDTDLLIMAERIGADTTFTSELAGFHRLLGYLCQYRPRNQFGGQGLFLDIGGGMSIHSGRDLRQSVTHTSARNTSQASLRE